MGLNRVLLGQHPVAQTRPAVRALHVELAEPVTDERTYRKLVVLLNLVYHAKWLSFALDGGGVLENDARRVYGDCFSRAVELDLSQHKAFTHFALEGLFARPNLEVYVDNLFSCVHQADRRCSLPKSLRPCSDHWRLLSPALC